MEEEERANIEKERLEQEDMMRRQMEMEE